MSQSMSRVRAETQANLRQAIRGLDAPPTRRELRRKAADDADKGSLDPRLLFGILAAGTLAAVVAVLVL